MSETNVAEPLQTAARARPMSVLRLFVASFVALVGIGILGEAVQYSSLTGWISRTMLFYVPVFCFLWAMYCLAPGCLVYAIFSLPKLLRFRTAATMTPSVVGILAVVGFTVYFPKTPAGRLKHFTNVSLPKSAHDLRTDFSGIGIEGFEETIFFHCAPEDTDLLIAELGLASDDTGPNTFHPPDASWPNPSAWKNSGYYSSGILRGGWEAELRTNEDRRQVYLSIARAPVERD